MPTRIKNPPAPKRLVIAILAALLIWPIGAWAAAEPGPPVTVARLPLSRYRLGVALAGSRVGANAFLLDIARMAAAQCAMNGSFFAAYPGETGEPYGTVAINGKLLHVGRVGTRMDVLAGGKVQVVRVPIVRVGVQPESDTITRRQQRVHLHS